MIEAALQMQRETLNLLPSERAEDLLAEAGFDSDQRSLKPA
jgi:hypothetical protein